ncbi:MAG: TldD/PmbA family protein [Candidatus Thorarchaeota archaeon]|jgi:predicted Zn-dependent protease
MDFMKDDLMEKASFALKETEKHGATQTEVEVFRTRNALTRLANSIIDQNVAENRITVRILVYLGKRKGSYSLDALAEDDIKGAAETAVRMAKVSAADKDFISLPELQQASAALSVDETVCEATANATPEERAEAANSIIKIAHDIDKRVSAVSGAISNGFTEQVIVNSQGVSTYQANTASNLNLTIMAKDGSEETAGWSSDNRRDFRELRIDDVTERAARKAAEGFDSVNLDPGEYELILEPAAVGGFTLFMIYTGFSALTYQDYRSFLRDRIGEKVFSDKLTMWDDSLDQRHPAPRTFDYEGYPKSKLDLIDSGTVKNLVYDSYTAGRDDVDTTGHAARVWGRSMPFADHVIVKDGDSSVNEMIEETRNGILVTHFHYQNPVDSAKGMMTGLTRDGAWLVKDGEIAHPVKTLRYTDALPRFLGNIDLVGRYQNLRDSAAIVPPLKLPSFKITGSSKQG